MTASSGSNSSPVPSSPGRRTMFPDLTTTSLSLAEFSDRRKKNERQDVETPKKEYSLSCHHERTREGSPNDQVLPMWRFLAATLGMTNRTVSLPPLPASL